MASAEASSPLEEELLALLDSKVPPEGMAWLRETAQAIAAGSADIGVVFPGVSRRVGRGGLNPSVEVAADRARALVAWRVDDAARTVLILAAQRRGGPIGALVRQLYERGDARERTAALRALSLLPDDAGLDEALPAVLDAVRTNQGEIFEAALCDNAFASARLPDLELRKAILKAVFIGLSIRRVVRLEARADAALTASLLDLINEREAASRPIAPELWPVMALYPPPGLAAKLLGYLEHPSAEHRAAAATALGRLGQTDGRVRSFLVERAAREDDASVRAAIAAALPIGRDDRS